MSTLTIVRVCDRAHLQAFIETIKFITCEKEGRKSQRAFWRFRCRVPVRVEIEKPETSTKVFDAYMYNISLEGLCFLSIRDFKRGQRLHVTIETNETFYKVFGIVTHSTHAIDYYQTGLKFEFEKDKQSIADPQRN